MPQCRYEEENCTSLFFLALRMLLRERIRRYIVSVSQETGTQKVLTVRFKVPLLHYLSRPISPLLEHKVL